jgi:predicted transposase YdaD
VHSQDVLVAAELKGEEKGIAKGEARGLKKGEAIGLAKGIEEGVVKGKIEAAIKLLKRKKLNDAEICEDLDFSPNELAKLKQQHKL